MNNNDENSSNLESGSGDSVASDAAPVSDNPDPPNLENNSSTESPVIELPPSAQ